MKSWLGIKRFQQLSIAGSRPCQKLLERLAGSVASFSSSSGAGQVETRQVATHFELSFVFRIRMLDNFQVIS